MKRSRILYLVVLSCLLWPVTAFASGAGGSGGEVSMTHRMMLLAIQLGLILFAAKLGNIFFEKIKLPGALGELVVGIIIGPYALGHLGFYGFDFGLFPLRQGAEIVISPELYGLSSIAAIVLLFNVGLETDLKLMLKYSLAGGIVGLGGMFASFFLGAASVMFFSEMLFGQSLSLFDPQCLFLGTITTATSVGITARILSERRKLDSPEGVTILSAAVIDDVMGIILLAVVMSIVGASKESGSVDWGHIGMIAFKAIGVWLVATIVALAAARKISFLLKWFGEKNSIAIMALGLALIMAGLFEEAGLAMIIGAYVMGLSLSQADISHVVQERLRPIYVLLVPVFFCTTGMQINLGVLTEPAVLMFGFAYAFAALFAKVAGCGIPAMLANFNLRGAARIGFGMAPRCEVALIIAGVGLAAGMKPEILAAVIIMVVVNTVIAPPAMVFLFRSSARGTRKPVAGDDSITAISLDFPSPEMVEFFAGKLRGVFEAEGFFVHNLSSRQRLYQLRKDKTIIDFRYSGKALTFSCQKTDATLVNTAVHETLAELDKAIKELKEPLDAMDMRTKLQDAGPLGPVTLSMKKFLTRQLIEPELQGTNKAEIIDELLGILKTNGLIGDMQAAHDAIWERENSMSTGLQFGVAIPHGKTDTVDRLICAVGIKSDGVDFDSMDGDPSTIVVLTLSPKSKPAPHIQFMSTISQVLNHDGRERILACRGVDQLFDAFTARPKELTGLKAPASPAPPATLQDSLAEFSIGDYIKPELLTVALDAATKEDAIVELLDMLEANGLIRDSRAAGQAVLDRETQLSTGVGHGIAIPHGRTGGVDKLLCAVGVARAGIDFGAIDEQPVTIIVLVLTPEDGTEPYLQFVASVMSTLDDAGRRSVLSAGSDQELWSILTRLPVEPGGS
jgi:Kef-type K+ transport system membrane component KefB/mannitol/fructose-specific phosphotransferase system IIA component (Ntr-type)